MGAVTTNPWLIAIINMTIVFGVLIALGVLMSLIQVVDPTKKKADAPKVAAPAPAPAAAPVAAPAASSNDEIIAAIAAAVAALGCSADDIAYVRRLPNTGWTNAARVEANSVRKECF
ncbi:MAG: OadG family protein [Phascolarctobacterium sp.]|nr:OadG family protein [Phascolarctobacterium sp.]MBQ7884331.1 OadG family protein [Phascolarctobacterium sp.]MBQ8624481.1 OadG family protein [Oscillospiraceae bacterium]